MRANGAMSVTVILAFITTLVIGSGTSTADPFDSATPLTTHPDLDSEPAWSPSGAEIAFESYRGGNRDLWAIPAGGGTATQITFDPDLDGKPSWSPDGTQIAFASRRGGNWNIWVISATGGTATQLTTDPGIDGGPVWSPDGTQIAFYSLRSGNADIWVMPATGGTATQITTDPDHDVSPDWQGTLIAFSSSRSGNDDIWVIPDAGGVATQVTTDPADDRSPSWSPDDSEIAFSSFRSPSSDIWIVPVGGGSARQLTADPASDGSPAWSPDGSSIAFVSYRSGNSDIWLIDPDSSLPQHDVHIVHADGTGDFPTIQAAILAAAEGDTVELTNGTYTGPGNRNIDAMGKLITIRSQSDTPEACVIDCEGVARGFIVVSGEGNQTVVRGVTVTNGYNPLFDSGGGAVYAANYSLGTFINCRFVDNVSEGDGGAVYCNDCDTTFRDCAFVGNTAPYEGGAISVWHWGGPNLEGCEFVNNSGSHGGAIYYNVRTLPWTITSSTFTGNVATVNGGAIASYASDLTLDGCAFLGNTAAQKGGALFSGFWDPDYNDPAFLGCTLAGNSALLGSGVYCQGTSPSLESTIVAFGTGGAAIGCESGANPILSCSDLYGNAGGDWAGCVAGQSGVDGNFSEAPLFCHRTGGNHTLAANSPCLPGNHPDGADCGQIGAYGEGCATVGVSDATPGAIPEIFRASPNPFRSLVHFQLSGSHSSPARLTVHDPSGRAVRVVNMASVPPSGVITWDGAGADGIPVVPGAYFARLEVGDRTWTRKVIRLP